jgi:hypothetical protein
MSMIPHEFVERNVSMADAETVPCRICEKEDVHKEGYKYGRMELGWQRISWYTNGPASAS